MGSVFPNIDDDRLYRFTTHPGEAEIIYDPSPPMSEEKKKWCIEEWERRRLAGEWGFSADDIKKEYDRRKAAGTL